MCGHQINVFERKNVEKKNMNCSEQIISDFEHEY